MRGLIEQAVRETDCAVVSIFVNPIQFNDPRDYGQYPRTLVEDAALCGRLGAPIVFAPAAKRCIRGRSRASSRCKAS